MLSIAVDSAGRGSDIFSGYGSPTGGDKDQGRETGLDGLDLRGHTWR